MSDIEKIYTLDQVTPKPGRAQEFLDAYMKYYGPGAKARGMKLEFSWITPPMWLENQSNTLYFVWSVPNVAGWWAAQMNARVDQSLVDWWRDMQVMIESRRRNFLADVSQVARLTHV